MITEKAQSMRLSYEKIWSINIVRLIKVVGQDRVRLHLWEENKRPAVSAERLESYLAPNHRSNGSQQSPALHISDPCLHVASEQPEMRRLLFVWFDRENRNAGCGEKRVLTAC
jgi:hypothetical protein